MTKITRRYKTTLSRLQAFQYMASHPIFTLNQIGQVTDLTRGSIAQFITSLMAQGWVVDPKNHGLRHSLPGRSKFSSQQYHLTELGSKYIGLLLEGGDAALNTLIVFTQDPKPLSINEISQKTDSNRHRIECDVEDLIARQLLVRTSRPSGDTGFKPKYYHPTPKGWELLRKYH